MHLMEDFELLRLTYDFETLHLQPSFKLGVRRIILYFSV